jgi:hypothetical protein
MTRIIRVFPRKTKATPTDALAYFGPPDRNAEADEVNVSVTFTYDKAWAEHLAEQWRHVRVLPGDGARTVPPARHPLRIFSSEISTFHHHSKNKD